MKEIFSEIKIAIKSSLVILIIGVVVFLLGVVLGLTISLPSDVSDIFAYGFINYFANVYNVDFSPFSALFSNVFSIITARTNVKTLFITNSSKQKQQESLELLLCRNNVEERGIKRQKVFN